VSSQTKTGKQTTQRRDDNEQSKLFISKAREIEADEKSSASDHLLGRLAKMKPEPRVKRENGRA
jgi:hypothetical protein